MIDAKFEYAASKVPVFVGEFGVNQWQPEPTLTEHMLWARNFMKVCNEIGIGFLGWNWSVVNGEDYGAGWGLITDQGWLIAGPSPWGQELIDAIAQVGPQPLSAFANGPYSATLENPTVQFQGFASGGTGPYDYTVDFGDGSPAVSGSSTGSISIAHTYPAEEQTYNITLTVTDAVDATVSDSATANITVTPPTPKQRPLGFGWQFPILNFIRDFLERIRRGVKE